MAMNWKQVRTRFQSLPADVQAHFEHYPTLLEDFPWKISMAYLFSEIEAAHRTIIYCGVVKIHRVDASMANSVVDSWRMKREEYAKLFETVFGQGIPAPTAKALAEAERVRDRIMHGAAIADADHRGGQVRLFDYVDEMHTLLPTVGGVSPFKDLRGIKGAGQPLTKQTSRWVLKGLGFNV